MARVRCNNPMTDTWQYWERRANTPNVDLVVVMQLLICLEGYSNDSVRQEL